MDISWAKHTLVNSILNKYWMSLIYLSDSLASTVPADAVNAAIYITGCLALGLFISACIYPPVESFLHYMAGFVDMAASRMSGKRKTCQTEEILSVSKSR